MGTMLVLIRHTNEWAAALQQAFIIYAKKQNRDSSPWERPWIRVLFKFIVIWFGVVGVIVGAFALLFGPIAL